MKIQSAMLWSDWLIWLLFFIALATGFWMRRYPHLRDPWRQILHRRLGVMALVV